MRKPRIPHAPIPDAADFSPTEVATLGLLGIKRSDIYLRIRCGDIEAILDEHGHYRITGAEIKRLQAEWRVDPKRIKPSPELVKAAQRSRARIATLENAAKYSAQEIGNRAVQGKRRHYAEQIDPEHKLPPDELERRIRRKDEASMERARLAKIERRMLREQYGQDPA